VLQWESLSPKLFTLFLEEVNDIMHSSNIPTVRIAAQEIHMLLYADDIVHLATNALELQQKINVLKQYFDENKLDVNLERTKCVAFRLKCTRRSSIPALYLGVDKIEKVNKYT
jgi:hypothetical protein